MSSPIAEPTPPPSTPPSPITSPQPSPAPVQGDDDTPPPRGGIAGRVLAGVVGVLLLAGGAVSTLGAALLAPLGMLGAGMLARAKGRPLSRGAAWAGAVTIAVLAFAVAGTVAVARTPAGTFERMRHDADSARKVAATQPPPPWLERIAPGAAKARQQQQMDSTAARIVGSPAFVIWTMIMGGMLTCFVFGGFAGTVGWGGSTLLYYAARGRWLPRRKRATSLPES